MDHRLWTWYRPYGHIMEDHKIKHFACNGLGFFESLRLKYFRTHYKKLNCSKYALNVSFHTQKICLASKMLYLWTITCTVRGGINVDPVNVFDPKLILIHLLGFIHFRAIRSSQARSNNGFESRAKLIF